MALTAAEYALYRDILSITGTERINDVIRQYAAIQHTRAMNTLKTAIDPYNIHRAQGEIIAWENIANIRDTAANILKHSPTGA